MFGLSPDGLGHRENAWRVCHQLRKRFIEPIDRGDHIDFNHAGRLFRLWIFDSGLRIVDSWDLRPSVLVGCDYRDMPAAIESTLAAFFQETS
jgi:hypothetical protein